MGAQAKMICLHGHSEYSILDGICKIPEYVARAKELGMDALALTDHGTLGGLVDFHFECRKQGIKPILGCEFYHEKGDNHHIIILARNFEGYKNLIELQNRSQQNFYKKPRITDKDIRECGNGLIGTSACLGGYLASTYKCGNVDYGWIKEMEDCFDYFFYELHDNQIPEQYEYNEFLLKHFKDKCIGVNDVHFVLEEHQYAHEVALAINTNKKVGEFKFPGSGYWMKSEFDLPLHVLDRTDYVASLVEDYDIGYEDWHLPKIDVNEEMFWFELSDQLFMLDLGKEYEERLEYEYRVIKENGFVPYFKIVADIYRSFNEQKKFVGWGRGSTSGSLVAYLLGITKIDPIKWGLLFERFLNPGRVTMPDIDMDFQPKDRQLAIQELSKYGKAIQIGTYGTLGTKEVINTVSKAMDIKTGLGDYVPNEAPIPTIKELMQTKAFISQVHKENNSKLVEVCMVLEGCKRSMSTHAAGVVLVDELIPIKMSRSGVNKGMWTTEWDMYALEKMKYVKFDILGVRNLEIIDKICKQVGILPDEIPLDDEDTFRLIRNCETVGIFQWESEGYRNIIRRLQPDVFNELIDLNTLYRPGCLESGITDEYIDRKFGRKPVVQLHPKLKMETQGLPLYQEDIITMVKELAGFSLSEADVLRKAIGKKEKQIFESIKISFIEGCFKTSDIDQREAEGFWDQIEKFARYTWNKAHAVAYTLISWWTAYLSTKYPVEFMCVLLNMSDSSDRRRILLSECRRREIPIKYPSLNKSDWEFRVDDGAILLGLSGIKYVGSKTVEKIMEKRAIGDFVSLDDFVKRPSINKRAVKYLGYAGVLQEFDVSVGNLDEEREALGYNLQERQIDKYWWSKYCENLGEVIELHKILTKHGDPMAFIKFESAMGIKSVTCFPSLWSQIKEKMINGSVAVFKYDDRDVLLSVSSPDVMDFRVHVEDGEGLLSFAPTLIGQPNIYCGGIGISRLKLDEELLSFIDREFRVLKIEV